MTAGKAQSTWPMVSAQVYRECCTALTARPTSIPDHYGVPHFSFLITSIEDLWHTSLKICFTFIDYTYFLKQVILSEYTIRTLIVNKKRMDVV